MPKPSAAIFGCSGLTLSADEKAFFRDVDPLGFILFARNVSDPDQVARLTDDLRETTTRNALILVDQEGGRVARLKPPHWREWDGAPEFCARFDGDEPALAHGLIHRHRLIAQELREVGIDVNCLPMADVAAPGADPIIADRALGGDPMLVANRARCVAVGLRLGGVLPVLKHIPGHGRATVDSHEALPVVDTPLQELRDTDFRPFRDLADLPLGMTAHVVFSAIDDQACATWSPRVVNEIRTDMGFDGLLMTDDLSMGALGGDFHTRAAAAFAAGCDIALHCNGDMDEMQAVAGATPRLSGKGWLRAEAALNARPDPDIMPYEELDALLDGLLDAQPKETADA